MNARKTHVFDIRVSDLTDLTSRTMTDSEPGLAGRNHAGRYMFIAIQERVVLDPHGVDIKWDNLNAPRSIGTLTEWVALCMLSGVQ